MNQETLDLIRKHAIQGVTDPQFAKDQCALILELLDRAPKRAPRTLKKQERYAHMAAHFARGLHLAGIRPMEQSATIAALWFEDAKGWWGVERPTTPDQPMLLEPTR
jgi:hypothetical protein